MCFLKNIYSPRPLLHEISVVPKPDKSESDTQYLPSQQFLSFTEKPSLSNQNLTNQFFIYKCMNFVTFNSQIIQNLSNKLNQAEAILEQSFNMIQKNELLTTPNNQVKMEIFQTNVPEKDETNLHETSDPLVTQLFGKQKYRYKLLLDHSFSETLYKDRNFGFRVKLVDSATGREKSNGNLINICLSVCDCEGEWVHQTKEGLSFIRGKVETELYHGEGQFIKLSPKDVSRSFPSRQVNLVVYPKPTMLKYSGESSLQERIDERLIEPLVIHSVSIKAKKRE